MKTVLLLLVALAASARADLKSDPPATVAAYLAPFDFPTKQWTPGGGLGRYHLAAVSDPEPGNTKINKFLYQCYGTEKTVENLELHLALNSPADAAGAEDKMAKAVASLCQSATGARLPTQAATALAKKKSGEWKIKGYFLNIDNLPQGGVLVRIGSTSTGRARR
jgi:hypothetical protein